MGGERTRIRDHIVSALYADLVGPFEGAKAHLTSRELLRRRPSTWYLTGFLVPEGNQESADDDDDLGVGDDVPADDAGAEEQEPKQRKTFPASMGFSVLLPPAGEIDSVDVTVSFARYERERVKEEGEKGPGRTHWRRVPHGPEIVKVSLDPKTIAQGISVPNTIGAKLIGRLATITDGDPVGIESGTRALSIFLVNQQALTNDDHRDEYTFFQVQMELRCQKPLVPRPNRRGERSLTDLDARISELQYRHRVEYAVGHNVGVEPAGEEDEKVYAVRTRWLPETEVRLVDARPLEGVTVSMEKLAELEGNSNVRTALARLPEAYREWIAEIRAEEVGSKDRTETKELLMKQAELACRRMEEGIALLEQDAEVLEAFRIANEAMALASRKRTPERGEPRWRLFQLAFLLLNLPATANPKHKDRETTELIFFPTGGGKTEAYLGLIGFALALRRMRGQSDPHGGLGVAVILRYTLRLLTLDQLERATALICALEVLRRQRPQLLGDHRFAVGLWVGKSAAANTMADIRTQLDDYQAGIRDTSPVPLETCPWCKNKLEKGGIELRPTKTKAERVVVRCMNAGTCDFANPHPDGLPLAFVDEQVYHELPCFLIATVDKFAMMPWRGEAGMLFGRVTAEKDGRFFGPLDKQPRGATQLPDGLLPPELIVQDELHLITGPLGTMVGLYEVAIEALCTQTVDGKLIKPKIIASTATAHHAADQIRALYGRKETATFPPPGIDALETYFSVVNDKDPGRLYVGVAAPGHPLKRILLRTYVAVLSAAQKAYRDKDVDPKLVDGYMTLVGYFNSLRELGGMRRLVEDDVRYQCSRRAERLPAEIANRPDWFTDRTVSEPLELTSREPTGRIAETKARLARPYADDENTDVLLASNMISVGVDIGRLGLMVVAGQPRTTSEYIQATSRVGRERERPGLVINCFNMVRPRDRSHYEHFVAYHESFYRFVEAQSVTPFASRALERGLTGALLSLARLKLMDLTRPEDAGRIPEVRPQVDELVTHFVDRASRQPGAKATSEESARRARSWAENRLDIWERLVRTARDRATERCYSPYDISKPGTPLLHTALKPPEDPEPGEEKFCAPTSMRDVEPSVHLWMAQPGVSKRGQD